MKRLVFVLPLAFLLASVSPYRQATQVVPARSRDSLTIYQLASIITGAPEEILRGIAFAESSENDNAIGDDGESIGRFQLREIYHGERAAKWGEYDPRNPQEAAIIAGRILADNLARLGDMDLAIAAYRQGVDGVRRDGATSWYIDRVKKGATR